MTDIKFTLQSTVHDQQLNYLTEQAKSQIKEGASKEEIQLILEEAYSQYLNNIGSPIYKRKEVHRGQLPYLEDFVQTMQEVIADIQILYNEHDNTSKFITDTYNYMHTEKKRMLSQIGGLNSLVGDLNLIANESQEGNIYFKESFENPKSQDNEFQLSNIESAQISSTEGVLTLARQETVNVSENAEVVSVVGNGEKGTDHISRRVQITDKDGQKIDTYIFLNSNESIKNDDPAVLLDNRSDTIFEYQTVNVPTDFINQYKRYDFDWVKGEKEGSKLRVKLVVELDKVQTINWIHINPYYPANSTSKVNVYSIRTSKDGFEYEGLFEKESFVINKELNETPQTYKTEDLFDTTNNPADAKYTSQGVWGFPAREARFVEFVFDQPESYKEVIGHEAYFVQGKDQDFWTQIPKVPELVDSLPGEYIRYVNGESITYKKEIVATPDGWRYVVGLRDLNIMSYRFHEKSSFVSQKYEVEGEIGKVMLYANEKIPETYLTEIAKNNDWVTYEVTFDDTTWFRISPMHQEPVNDDFPPKILELNGNELDLASAFQVHKQNIKTDEKPTSIRFRATLSRPEGDEFYATTPIVEDVAIRVVKKEDIV